MNDIDVEYLWIRISINVNDMKTNEDAEVIVKSLEMLSQNHNDIRIVASVTFIKNEDFEHIKQLYSTPSLGTSLDYYIKNSDNTEREVVININSPDVKVETSEYVEEIIEKTKVY